MDINCKQTDETIDPQHYRMDNGLLCLFPPFLEYYLRDHSVRRQKLLHGLVELQKSRIVLEDLELTRSFLLY